METRFCRTPRFGADSRNSRAAAALRDESGVVAVIAALVMVVLLSVVALVIDLGGLYDHDRELQTAADAGALAGAQELVLSNGDLGRAAAKAQEYVSQNCSPNSATSSVVQANLAPWTPAVDATSVTVNLREDHVAFTFARVFGKQEGSVTAHARAEVKYLTGVEKLFPVALLMMNPEKFRFVFYALEKNGKRGVRIGSFDIVDENGNGIFGEHGEGGDTLPVVKPGLYTVDLQAVDKDAEGNEVVGLELPDIGYWWVGDPSNPQERLYRVGMSRELEGSVVTVKAEAKTAAGSLAASLGGKKFDLTRQSGNTFTGTVAAPTGYKNNDGYGVHELEISFPKEGDLKATTITCGRYVAFASDVPIKYLMMEPSFYAGYSRLGSTNEFQRAVIVTDHPDMWDYYTMKLGTHAGSGLYAGNWRLADIYKNQNTRDELAQVDPAILNSWELNTPLYIGGPLWPETGAKVGQVWQGLDDRKAAWQQKYPDDPDGWRYVIVPFVNYDPDLSGTSKKYVIQMFAAFRIYDYQKKGEDKGEITGQFIRWVAPGTWSDEPSGPLYVETAVLVE